jgi:hypothetical protein
MRPNGGVQLKCYRVEQTSELSKVAAWIAEEQLLQNQSLTLCWAGHHKAAVDYVTVMLQKRLSSICVAEDDSGKVKAVLYFEFRDEQDKVPEKWATFATTVIDREDWAKENLDTFKELLKLSYGYCCSQGAFKGEFWVLEKIFKCHQEMFGPEYLTVLEEHNMQPLGNTIRFRIDIKGAMESLTVKGLP